MSSTAFYPSCVVNFKLRFDEALTVVETPSPESVDQRVLAPTLTGPVGSFLGAGAASALSSAITAAQGAASNVKPSTQPLVTKVGKTADSFVRNRVPRHLSTELPGYRSAGTFELTIDYADLPIDPRTLRSAAVEVHFGAVSADDFAAGMRGERVDGRPLSILRTRESTGDPRLDTLDMVGLVDEWKVQHHAQGSTVSISGRDLRSALIDSKLGSDPAVLRSLLKQLDTSRPIDEVVQQILSYHPAHDLFVIETNPFEWPGTKLPAPLGAESVPRVRKGARGKRKGGSAALPGGQSDMSFWDLITQFCYLVGAIPYFAGYFLRIRPSRAIFDQLRAGFDPSIPTPFAGGALRQVGQEKLAVRRLVYGRDVEDLEFSKKFGGTQKPHTIRCVSTDPTGKGKGKDAYITAIWPPNIPGDPKIKKAKTQTVDPSGQKAHEEILEIPCPGVTSKEQMQVVAQGLYEEIGRNEMGGSCKTKKLASFGGDNTDPDLVRLKPGDGVEFLTDIQQLSSGAPVVSTYTNSERVPFDAAVENIRRKLGDKIGDDNLARVIVSSARGLVFELQRFFRVANVKKDFDANSGIDISFDFQNYFVVRADVSPPLSSEPGAVKKTVVPHNTRGT